VRVSREPDRSVVVEQLRVPNVAARYLFAFVERLSQIASRLFPFFAAVVAKPARRECPATVFGSSPARSAPL
jgi:hypothetical protein